MTWKYEFSRHDPYALEHRCQEKGCGAGRAVYRLHAEIDGVRKAHRDFCLNHSAATASRLGLSFPPTDSKGIK